LPGCINFAAFAASFSF